MMEVWPVSGWFRGGWREGLWMVIAVLVFLAALVLPFTAALAGDLTPEEEQLLRAYERGDLIRLHIVAHSDSAQDQTIKLAVRDAVIDAFGDILTHSAQMGSDAAYQALKQNQGVLCRIAMQTAHRLGFDGTVTAETGILHLPEKSYGQVTLPEGDYRALRITLGSGQGQNWWCVLFPQLCLALSQDDHPSPAYTCDTMHILQNWLLKAD